MKRIGLPSPSNPALGMMASADSAGTRGRNTTPASHSGTQGTANRSGLHPHGGTADHVIRDRAPSSSANGGGIGADGKLVTFGIVAHARKTGYARSVAAGAWVPPIRWRNSSKSRRWTWRPVRPGRLLLEQRMFGVQAEQYSRSSQPCTDILEASRALLAAKTDLDFVRIDRLNSRNAAAID